MPSLMVSQMSVGLDFVLAFIACQVGGFHPRLTTPCHLAVVLKADSEGVGKINGIVSERVTHPGLAIQRSAKVIVTKI